MKKKRIALRDWPEISLEHFYNDVVFHLNRPVSFINQRVPSKTVYLWKEVDLCNPIKEYVSEFHLRD